MSQARYPVLRLSSSPTFFIALCKIVPKTVTPLQHSYIMAGCEDPKASIGYVFSAVGKFIDDPTLLSTNPEPASGFMSAVTEKISRSSALIKKAIGDSLEATLCDEKILTSARSNDGKEFHIQYQAYEISYQQYEDYIRLISVIAPDESLKYYFCSGLNEFTCSADVSPFNPNLPTSKEKLPKVLPAALSKFREFSPLNTCRQAAVEMLHQLGIDDENISSIWLSTLTHNMTIQHGKTVTPLFILPIPPSLQLKTQEPEFYALLHVLYQDIFQLSATNYGLSLARQKLEAMRQLYNQLITGKHDQDTIKNTFERWKEQKNLATNETNATLISKTRQTFYFSFFNVSQAASASAVSAAEKAAATLPLELGTTEIDGFENVSVIKP